MQSVDKNSVSLLRSSILELLDADNLSVDNLSMSMMMSKSHLHRIIKKNTGDSTSIFIRKVKLKKASDLLRHSDRTISEIAYQCGFSRPQLLSRYFQESYSMSPSEYRADMLVKQHHITDADNTVSESIGGTTSSDLKNERKLITVMPFVDKSIERDQNFLCAGITDELIFKLARFSNLRITGRESVKYLSGMSLSSFEIGKKLNANFVLNGSVKRSNNKIRVSVTLDCMTENELLWADRFDRELSDIFEVQDEISEEIAQRLQATLSQDKPLHKPRANYEHVDAYEAYLKGREAFEKRDNLDIALVYFEKAIDIDPLFANAYIGISYVHFYKCIFAGAPPIESLGAIQSAYQSAVRIDDDLPESHIIKGWIEFYFKHNTKEGIKAMDEAIAARPNLMDAYRIKAYFLCFSGRFEEGIALSKRAFEMDPLGFNAWFSYGDILRRARKYEEASSVLNQLLIEYPNNVVATEILGYCYLYSGKIAQARKFFSDPTRVPNHVSLYVLGTYIYNFQHGDESLLPDLLNELSEADQWIQPTILALLSFYVGDEDQAEMYLKIAKRELDFGMKHIIADQHWDPFREHPAVQKLLAEVGMI